MSLSTVANETAVNNLVALLVQKGYPPLLKQSHLKEITQLADSTLEQGRLTGKIGIPFVRIGRSVRYPLEGAAEYLVNLKRYRSTTEADAAERGV